MFGVDANIHRRPGSLLEACMDVLWDCWIPEHLVHMKPLVLQNAHVAALALSRVSAGFSGGSLFGIGIVMKKSQCYVNVVFTERRNQEN